MNRRAGFTLLEICLVVMVIVLVVLIAAPSVSGAIKAQRLQATRATFDTFVHKAQSRSVNERRTYVLAWDKHGIDLIPWETKEGEEVPPKETLPVGDNEDYAIERPAALGKEAGPVWTFWRSGVCEPAIIHYKGPLGTWVARYDPLTVHATILAEDYQ